MSEYTPGPWYVGKFCVWSENQVMVAATQTGIPEEIQQANARLIAAAPNLLLALKNLTAQIELDKLNIRKDYSLLNAHAWATKAIRKAEGAT